MAKLIYSGIVSLDGYYKGPGKDAMVRWEGTFEVPSSGSVTITMRATDGLGDPQTDDFQLPQPDGASGRDQITVIAA